MGETWGNQETFRGSGGLEAALGRNGCGNFWGCENVGFVVLAWVELCFLEVEESVEIENLNVEEVI